jgi:hypothetical protein
MIFAPSRLRRAAADSISLVLKKEPEISDAQLGAVRSLLVWTYCLCMAPHGHYTATETHRALSYPVIPRGKR